MSGFDIWREVELLGVSNPEADAMQTWMYFIIGQITAEWAGIDFTLDTLVLYIAGLLRDTRSDAYPRALRQKMRFLRAAFEAEPVLRPFAAEGKAVLSRINALKQKRHRVAHGMVLQTAFDHPHYRLICTDFRSNQLVTHHPITMKDLESAAAEIRTLVRDAIPFAVRVGAAIRAEQERREQAQ